MVAQSTEKEPSPPRASAGSARPRPSAPPAPDRLDESKPPPGRDRILTTSQIRYCLAEDIRLGAAKSVVNAYVDAEVDRFNEMVSDYNVRCGEYRYREGTLESARYEVERHRSDLEYQGRTRFPGGAFGGASGGPSASSGKANIDWQAVLAQMQEEARRTKPEPDATVRAVQQKLSARGYDAGTPDGLIGTKTVAAISAFQADAGLPVDGQVSSALLRTIEAAEVQNDAVASTGSANGAIARPRESPASLSPAPAKPDLSSVAASERQAIERACNGARQFSGPADYYACLNRELRALHASPGRPDLSQVSARERQAIENTCNGARQFSGPADYYACLNREFRQLRASAGMPDLGQLPSVERQAIERTCDGARQFSGPADYYACLNRELRQLRASPGKPDLSQLPSVERQAIERTCDGARQFSGPADYYACLNRELRQLRASPGKPDLSGVPAMERRAIERACDGARQFSGPADYYACLRRELAAAGYR